MSTDPRYPVGRFSFRPDVTGADRTAWIDAIADAPAALRAAVDGLSGAQLDTPYREGGWTVRQVVHHVFDSHCNAFIRFRLALTEENPRITAYDEAAWAELPDSIDVPAAVSLDLVDGLHRRWVSMMRHMDTTAWARTLQHPENGPMTLDRMLQLYAWHGKHHVAHITVLRQQNGW
jgi:uncharacterized damage-inducible protein DinB